MNELLPAANNHRNPHKPNPTHSTGAVFPRFQHHCPLPASCDRAAICSGIGSFCYIQHLGNRATLQYIHPLTLSTLHCAIAPGRLEPAKPRKMGGRVFTTGLNPLRTPRMPPAVYARAKEICHQALGKVFESVASPIEAPGKQDYVRDPCLPSINPPARAPSNSMERATLHTYTSTYLIIVSL
jgi:hypothetical protein